MNHEQFTQIKSRHVARAALAANLDNTNPQDVNTSFSQAVQDEEELLRELSDVQSDHERIRQKLEKEQLDHMATRRKLVERIRLHQDAMNEIARIRTKLKYARHIVSHLDEEGWNDEELEMMKEICKE